MRQWLNELLLLRCGFIESTDIWEIFSRNRTWKWRWGKLKKNRCFLSLSEMSNPEDRLILLREFWNSKAWCFFYSTSLPLIDLEFNSATCKLFDLCVGIYQDKSTKWFGISQWQFPTTGCWKVWSGPGPKFDLAFTADLSKLVTFSRTYRSQEKNGAAFLSKGQSAW